MILFVVSEKNETKHNAIQRILTDTEMCAGIYLNMEEGFNSSAEQSMIAVLNQYSTLDMVVIAASENGVMLNDALSLSKIAKDRGILCVIAVDGRGKTTAEYLADQSLDMETILKHTDCILFTPIWRECMDVDQGESQKVQFYEDMNTFLQFMETVLEGNGFIYLDIEDIKPLIKDAGFVYMGIGSMKGSNTEVRRAKILDNELLPKDILQTAKGTIMHIVGSMDMGLEDVDAVEDAVQKAMTSGGDILFGAGFDDQLKNEICIYLLAVGDCIK